MMMTMAVVSAVQTWGWQTGNVGNTCYEQSSSSYLLFKMHRCLLNLFEKKIFAYLRFPGHQGY